MARRCSCERCFAAESVGVVAGGDKERGGNLGADATGAQQRRVRLCAEVEECLVQGCDLGGEIDVSTGRAESSAGASVT